MYKKLYHFLFYVCFLWIIFVIYVIGASMNEYNSMTAEEREAYEASKIHEYKVISVCQYISVETNNFGNVLDQSLKYCFTYVDDNGQLHQVNEFKHTNNGLSKVCLGNEDKYVVKEGFDTYRWLYLTEKTFNNISSK